MSGFTKHVPNIITLCNLFSGCIAVLYAVQGNLIGATVFVCLGIFFDYFDGFAARLFNASGELGLQLDSLADMVTSGVVPGITMVHLLQNSLAPSLDGESWNISFGLTSLPFSPIALLGLLITLASAYRLAKFNIDTRQTDSFIGLPTPANTLLIMSLPLIMAFQNRFWLMSVLLNTWFLLGLTLVSCYLLNAEIPLFALKFKSFGWAENKIRYIFMLLCITFIILLKFIAIPLIILLYIGMSLVQKRNAI